ncbi:cytochrome c family protein [Sphingomonas sp. MG17]|uniref:Cytochrome c family protein n=1 Tax=Sphingomonas tagetis TaxID=2949092 RepID=A0A9X2KL13_9SPHN|nr:cytochrome c family protein [Sphingomonas tagetis]MCP3729941.1 cytochrome c family protein [Sphingomonas tagetis]
MLSWPLILLLLVLLVPIDNSASSTAARRFEGVASCAGSTCHGRMEGDGKVVRQDELRLWQEPSSRGGAHSRAYAVLSSPRGRSIAATLGLGAATGAPACLGCHATPGGNRGERFQLSDGVSCESCHGPASGWISSHYAMPATHAGNIAQGLIPLERPAVRAAVCLDCHFGSAKGGQFVTHSMMAAGHPRVSFELDLFSSLQQHWDEDADYARRKGRSDSVRLWAVGQAQAVQRSLGLFARSDFGMRGVFPEFYFYDCHSCHRPIDDGPAQRRTFETNAGRPIPFAAPPFNDENIIMLSAVAQVLAPGQASAFDAASRNFHAAMGKGRAEAVAGASRLDAAAGALGDAMARQGYSADTAFRVVSAIAGKTISPRFTDYAGSAQAVMAVDTLLNALVREGRVTVGAAAGIRADINRAYGAVSGPKTYNPAAFRAALGQAVRSIEALR